LRAGAGVLELSSLGIFIMSVRDRVAKQEKIDLNIDFGRYWRAFVDFLPEVVKSPTELIGVGLSSMNLLLE
jgi:hypothetical protein